MRGLHIQFLSPWTAHGPDRVRIGVGVTLIISNMFVIYNLKTGWLHQHFMSRTTITSESRSWLRFKEPVLTTSPHSPTLVSPSVFCFFLTATCYYSKLLQLANPQFVYLCFPTSSRQRDNMWAQQCLLFNQNSVEQHVVQMSPNSTLHFLRVVSNKPIKCEVDCFLHSLKYAKKILKDGQRFLPVWLHLLDLTKSCYFFDTLPFYCLKMCLFFIQCSR